ncbi:uncharacterized protein LOC131230787 isoform X3 [Magnolia sinica]|uniref:uncharacterized protein LOC131230787 isoform X3 n=1 Tax=Magnolia sinica TaxID=86752 RepID=UPI002659163F|nr:uncharacterized protein LOC131230787 isoform X3 [Magnolia sinica]
MLRFFSVFCNVSGIYRNVSGTVSRRALQKAPGRTTVLFVCVLCIGAFISARWLNSSIINNEGQKLTPTAKTAVHRHSYKHPKHPKKPPTNPENLLTCPRGKLTRTCPANRPTPPNTKDDRPSPSCPEYFRWIHEDLRPWKATGISKEMVERANRTANFRLVVINGRAYVEKYRRAFQTRDVFTLWGILQLLRRYPGRVPDLDLMFDCVDLPVVKSRDYRGQHALGPPPLFRYCGDEATLDIVFPDWSFWGWPELNIEPWETLSKNLKEGNERLRWIDREPYAYWKGNAIVASKRQQLLKCNVSNTHDWNARLYAQDWVSESRQEFKQSNLAGQCTQRYKIYIEGKAWSVSEKYILACNSLTLVVKPQYYDFFTRGLIPVHHYWPIRDDDKCRSIKFAVDWGNSHKQKAQEIGKVASSFVQEELKMDYVYDYMFHLLNEYAKLLTYKPTIPHKAMEWCLDSIACRATGLEKKFMMESMVMGPKDSSPCNLGPPFDSAALQAMNRRKENSIKQVETWEKRAWESQNI